MTGPRTKGTKEGKAMHSKRFLPIGSAVGAIAICFTTSATAALPPTSNCIAQFDVDFHALFPGFTIGQLLGAPGQRRQPTLASST